MTAKIRFLTLACVAAGWFAAGATGGATSAADPTEAPLAPASSPGWDRVPVPLEAWSGSVADLGDLWAVNGAGDAVPMLVVRGPGRIEGEAVPGLIFNVLREGRGQLRMNLDAPADLVHGGVRLTFPAGAFIASAVVQDEYGNQLARDVLFQTGGSETDLILTWPPSDLRRIELVMTSADDDAPDLPAPSKVRFIPVVDGRQPGLLPLDRPLGLSVTGPGVLRIELPVPGLPVRELKWALPERTPVEARVRVVEDVWAGGQLQTQLLGEARWSGQRERWSVTLSTAPRSSTLYLMFGGAFPPALDNGPAEGSGASGRLAVFLQPAWALVYRKAGDGATLRWGSGESRGGHRLSERAVASWGDLPMRDGNIMAVRPVPGVAPRDPLAGVPDRAELPDPGRFRVRWPVAAEGGPGGWRRARLPRAAWGAMAADGRDLRIADDQGGAIPYVQVRGREVEEVPLTIAPTATRRGEQGLRITGLGAQEPLAALRIVIRSGPSRRTYTLQSAGRRDGATPLWLQGGTFAADRPGEHTLLIIPSGATYRGPGQVDEDAWYDGSPLFAAGLPVEGDLLLSFERGENPELDVVSATALVPVTALWYPESRPASFLYAGAKDLAGPAYDLSACAPPWSGGAPAAATLGPMEQNPSYRPTPDERIASHKGILYGVLALTLAVLGWIALKAFRAPVANSEGGA